MEVILALALAIFSLNSKESKTVQPQSEEIQEVYNPSETRVNDIIHTSLEVSFDWQNQYVLGYAQMDVKPHFYPTNQLVLDAKGFYIHSVKLNKKEARYTYDNFFITIESVSYTHLTLPTNREV